MKTVLSATLILTILMTTACVKKNDITDDICKGKTQFKADFTIEEMVRDTSYITDKALAPGYILFRALGDYDSLIWIIGNTQNISNKRNPVLYFNQAEGTIDVTLIGYLKPNKVCFPNSKSVDTIKKTLTILERDQTAGIVGRFLGYNLDNPSDTFSVYVNADKSRGFWQYYIKNLPKNCPGYVQVSDEQPNNIGLNASIGYSAFRLINTASTVCASVTGFGQLKNRDSLIINYSAIPMSSSPPYNYGTRTQFTFVGIRKPW